MRGKRKIEGELLSKGKPACPNCKILKLGDSVSGKYALNRKPGLQLVHFLIVPCKVQKVKQERNLKMLCSYPRKKEPQGKECMWRTKNEEIKEMDLPLEKPGF